MLRRITSNWVFLLGILLLVGIVHAHRIPSSLTTITPTPDGVEIVHRLHRHDAEMGVAKLWPEFDPSANKLETEAMIALYVEENFAMAVQTQGGPGAVITLNLIGAEVSGDSILVFQETQGALPDHLAIRNEILRDVFATQVNVVNIEIGGSVRSLNFGKNDRWLDVHLQ